MERRRTINVQVIWMSFSLNIFNEINSLLEAGGRGQKQKTNKTTTTTTTTTIFKIDQKQPFLVSNLQSNK